MEINKQCSQCGCRKFNVELIYRVKGQITRGKVVVGLPHEISYELVGLENTTCQSCNHKQQVR